MARETEATMSNETPRKEPKNYSWATLLTGETRQDKRRDMLKHNVEKIAKRMTEKFVEKASRKKRYTRKRTRWNEMLMIPGSSKYSKLERDLGYFALDDSGRKYM